MVFVFVEIVVDEQHKLYCLHFISDVVCCLTIYFRNVKFCCIEIEFAYFYGLKMKDDVE